MVLKRFLWVMLAAFVVQGVLFSYSYRDLLVLRSPASVLAASPDTFRHVATQALQRPVLTRRHLETLANAANLTGDLSIEVTARQRLWQLSPGETHLGLELADSLRRARRLDEAQRIYQQLLGPTLAGGTR